MYANKSWETEKQGGIWKSPHLKFTPSSLMWATPFQEVWKSCRLQLTEPTNNSDSLTGRCLASAVNQSLCEIYQLLLLKVCVCMHGCCANTPLALLYSFRQPLTRHHIHFNERCPEVASVFDSLWGNVQKHITPNQTVKYKDNHWP